MDAVFHFDRLILSSDSSNFFSDSSNPSPRASWIVHRGNDFSRAKHLHFSPCHHHDQVIPLQIPVYPYDTSNYIAFPSPETRGNKPVSWLSHTAFASHTRAFIPVAGQSSSPAKPRRKVHRGSEDDTRGNHRISAVAPWRSCSSAVSFSIASRDRLHAQSANVMS